MHVSQVLVLGVAAFATQALAGDGETIIDTTVITVTSCAPEVTNCPGSNAPAGPTTEEVTETSTYCPPTVATPVVPVGTPVGPATTVVSVGPVGSSVTVEVSVPTTPAGSATEVAPGYSNSVIPVTSAPMVSTSVAPVVPVVVGNSTFAVSTLAQSETSILVATGHPTTSTSVSIAPSTTHAGTTTSASATASPTSAAGLVVVPAFMIGVFGAAAILLV